MTDTYRIFGSELSPYSVKVRSYFRYKQIPHEWLSRARQSEEFKKYARLPLVPLVVTPEPAGMQDSTPILEAMEERFAEPSIYPDDPTLRFLSALLEEYADEWGNKHMFHYRWWYEPDQISTARRIAASMAPEGAPSEQIEEMAKTVRERMVPRLSFVGSSELTKGQIETSMARLLAILEAHLETRPYVLGGRPAMADFGLWGQVYECSTDPTIGAVLADGFDNIQAWIERMHHPKNEGAFEDWDSLQPTLAPLLHDEVGGLFLPWSNANATALDAGEESFSVELEGRAFSQQTQKYHARSLAAIRAKYAAVAGAERLDAILDEAGCLGFLSA
jgi:glutathione S-transferase